MEGWCDPLGSVETTGMSFYQLDFEREIVELEERIQLAEQGQAGSKGAEIPALGGVEGADTHPV